MADPNQLDILVRQGAEQWNTWRNDHPEAIPDLRNADFHPRYPRFPHPDYSAADLRSADLRGATILAVSLANANLSEADLTGAYICDVTFCGATLVHSDLRDTRVYRTDFTAADLSSIILSGADCRDTSFRDAILREAAINGTHFHHADFHGADLTRASAFATVFGDSNLNGARGLDSVWHHGPTTIGIDTILRSRGLISHVFLRNAGVPEDLISRIRSLDALTASVEFRSCFISYSSKDATFAERLCEDLQRAGVPCWYFPRSATWGENVWGEIDKGVKTYDKLIVVCSQHSLQSSPVLREVERALIREDEERKNVLFPLRIDDYLLAGWEHPRRTDVLTKVVADFSDWDRSSDEYNASLGRLLEALKAPGETGRR